MPVESSVLFGSARRETGDNWHVIGRKSRGCRRCADVAEIGCHVVWYKNIISPLSNIHQVAPSSFLSVKFVVGRRENCSVFGEGQ